MNVIIRKANKKDLKRIVELFSELYIAEQPFDSNLKDGYYETKNGKKGILKDIKNKKEIFLVAIIDDIIVGIVDGHVYDKEDLYIEKVAYLSRLVVDKNYKNKGIATRLINEFTNEVKKENVKFIKLNAFESNTPAVSLYKKEGFNEYSVFYMKKIDYTD